MSTRAVLKARIADDLDRDDITTQIEEAIADAITAYESEPFWWNEGRSITFSTVGGTWSYDAAGSVGLIMSIDALHVLIGGRVRQLVPEQQNVIEHLTEGGTTTERGEPTRYSFYDQALYLHPIPSAAWTVRVIGTIKVPEPATDLEANNPWMMRGYGFELIRCRAKAYLAVHVVDDANLLQAMGLAEASALETLRAKHHRLTSTGRIIPTSF